jgi:hypothetical protein
MFNFNHFINTPYDLIYTAVDNQLLERFLSCSLLSTPYKFQTQHRHLYTRSRIFQTTLVNRVGLISDASGTPHRNELKHIFLALLAKIVRGGSEPTVNYYYGRITLIHHGLTKILFRGVNATQTGDSDNCRGGITRNSNYKLGWIR